MLENLLNLDRELLIYLNSLGSNNWDFLWLILTDKLTFIPFFLFIIYLIFKNFSTKESIFILLSIALLILFTDQFTNFIKDSFERLRPCRDDSIKDLLRSIIDVRCGKYGFFSAHASNSMAISIFLCKLFSNYNYKILNYLLVLWVLIFSYSRIYLGVHFPLDIIFGLLFGLLFGTFSYKILENFILFRAK
jgi:undecaprenyl-diphosphatase